MRMPTKSLFLFIPLFVLTLSTAETRREQDLKVTEILDALGVSAGSQVADVGAGSGFFIPRLSERAGANGRVYAVDIDEHRAIPDLKNMVSQKSLTNVSVVHCEPNNPQLPTASLDGVLMVIAYHEVEPYREVLRHLKESLKPGGRLVVVDHMPGNRNSSRADQVGAHNLAPEIAEQEFREAGFEILKRVDHFVNGAGHDPGRWMIVSRRPA